MKFAPFDMIYRPYESISRDLLIQSIKNKTLNLIFKLNQIKFCFFYYNYFDVNFNVNIKTLLKSLLCVSLAHVPLVKLIVL